MRFLLIGINMANFITHIAVTEPERKVSWDRLQILQKEVLERFPQARETADQFFQKDRYCL